MLQLNEEANADPSYTCQLVLTEARLLSHSSNFSPNLFDIQGILLIYFPALIIIEQFKQIINIFPRLDKFSLNRHYIVLFSPS